MLIKKIAIGALALTTLFLRPLSGACATQENEPEGYESMGQIRDEIDSLVHRALQQTAELAAQPELVEVLATKNPKGMRALANRYIQNSDYLDVVAFFDREGRITAMNTVDHAGLPIEPERITNVFNKDFRDRKVIASCLANQSDAPQIEFQTQCDFTPALFDSSGLSVALSAPVKNAKGDKVGVVSTRLNFKRIFDIIASVLSSKSFDGDLFLVSDEGNYFSEEINSGYQSAPVAADRIRSLTAQAKITADTPLSFTEEGNAYLLLPMRVEEVIEGGNMYLLYRLPAPKDAKDEEAA